MFYDLHFFQEIYKNGLKGFDQFNLHFIIEKHPKTQKI